MDHKKAFTLLEEARLTEYFLTDEEKTKIKVDYLKKIQLVHQHRRLGTKKKEK